MNYVCYVNSVARTRICIRIHKYSAEIICELIIAFIAALYSYTNDNHNNNDDNNLINYGGNV